jgi:hypothetical protein
VNPHCSRKSFLARLAGLVAATGLAPRLFARAAPQQATLPTDLSRAFTLRPEPRAVPRRTEPF